MYERRNTGIEEIDKIIVRRMPRRKLKSIQAAVPFGRDGRLVITTRGALYANYVDTSSYTRTASILYARYDIEALYRLGVISWQAIRDYRALYDETKARREKHDAAFSIVDKAERLGIKLTKAQERVVKAARNAA